LEQIKIIIIIIIIKSEEEEEGNWIRQYSAREMGRQRNKS